MASIHDSGQSARNTGQSPLPVELPVPLEKGKYQDFPYHSKDGEHWFKVGTKGRVAMSDVKDSWAQYRVNAASDPSGSGPTWTTKAEANDKEDAKETGETEKEEKTNEMTEPEMEEWEKEEKTNEMTEPEMEEWKKEEKANDMTEPEMEEWEKEEESSGGHEPGSNDRNKGNKRKDPHESSPPPHDDIVMGNISRIIAKATGTKTTSHSKDQGHENNGEGGGSEGSRSSGDGGGESGDIEMENGDSNEGYRGSQSGEDNKGGRDSKDGGDSDDDRGDRGPGWDPVTEPEGYDPYASVDFATHATYYYRKERDEHWCILPDPGDNKKKKWALAEGRTWGVRQTVLASFHPIPAESKRPRRYYGFKSQEVGNFQTQLPYLLMASACQLRRYEKEKGTMPFIAGAAWDWDKEKEHCEIQSNPIRRVVFGPDLTTFGTFDKGPNTHEDRQFTKRAWASVSTCRAAKMRIDAEYAGALDRAGQKPPPRMKKPEVRSDLQAQGAMIRDSLIPGYLMGREETHPEVYRTGMVPGRLAHMLPEAHRAAMLPAPNRPSMDVESVRSLSQGLSMPPGQRDVVELESARSQSREPSVPRGKTPLESIETEPIRAQSREPSVLKGQTPLESTVSGSARFQSEGPSVFSQANTEVGSVRSESEGPFGQLLQKSLIEGSFGALVQEATRKIPARPQVHFED